MPEPPQAINLHNGWNLVGFPSNHAMTRDEALNTLFHGHDVDVIQHYDPTEGMLKTLGENELMESGRGYWFHATTDCIWEVPL
jgi:hypothetical protein